MKQRHYVLNPYIYPDLRAYYISTVSKTAFWAGESIRDWSTTARLLLTSVFKGPGLSRGFRSAVLGSAGLLSSSGMWLWKTLGVVGCFKGVCASPGLGVIPSDRKQIESIQIRQEDQKFLKLIFCNKKKKEKKKESAHLISKEGRTEWFQALRFSKKLKMSLIGNCQPGSGTESRSQIRTDNKIPPFFFFFKFRFCLSVLTRYVSCKDVSVSLPGPVLGDYVMHRCATDICLSTS